MGPVVQNQQHGKGSETLHFQTNCTRKLPFSLKNSEELCRIACAKPEDLEMWPKHQGQEFVIFSNGCLDLSANILIGDMVLV